MTPSFAEKYFTDNQQVILDEWFDLLRFPTVGADPKRLGDCSRAAAWLKQYLRKLDFDVEILIPDTGLPVPVVIGERAGECDAPVVMFYGHYDVQPEDPLAEWKTPPFEPELIEDRVYARGAQDNKGHLFAFLQGVKAMIEAGKPLPPLKIVLDGQEESGSGALHELAPRIKQRLQADVMMVSDTSCAPEMRPAIVAGLRGVIHFTLVLRGPAYDLHSGLHGGVAPNPAQAMAALLASMHNPDGSIAVEGFNDHIREPDPRELEIARQNMLSEEEYQELIGCMPHGGAEGFDIIQRRCFMPTIEINGIHTGYGGPGSKTVIPAEAMAKVSMRLVPDQSPHGVVEAVREHIDEHCPPGIEWSITNICHGAPGFRLPLDTPLFRLADEVLQKMDPHGAVFLWEGASIPIVSKLSSISGAAPLLAGFGQQEDKVHCPNESFSLRQFVATMVWSTMMLSALVDK